MQKIMANAFIILFCTGVSLIANAALFQRPPSMEILAGALLVPLVLIQAKVAIAWRNGRLIQSIHDDLT